METIIPMAHVRNMVLSEVNIYQTGRIWGFPMNTLFSAHALSIHSTALGGDTVEQCAAWNWESPAREPWGEGEEWLILTGIFCRNWFLLEQLEDSSFLLVFPAWQVFWALRLRQLSLTFLNLFLVWIKQSLHSWIWKLLPKKIVESSLFQLFLHVATDLLNKKCAV